MEAIQFKSNDKNFMSFRLCPKCGREYPATAEYFFPNKKGLIGAAPTCRNCIVPRSRPYKMVDGKDYRYRDPDYHRHYYEANKEKISEYTKKWNKAHPRKYVYKKKNPEQKRVQYNRRRSRKNRVPFNFTVADQRRALNYFHGYCPVCQKPLRDLFGDHHPQLDHWIPLADSRPDNPGTVPWNMVPLCNRCNSSKQGSDPLIWLESKFGKHKARLISERIERFFEWTKRKDGEAKAAR